MCPEIGIGIGFNKGGYIHGAALLPDLSDYIDGLITELSDDQLTKLNELYGTINDGFGIVRMTEAFDIAYNLAGETAESSLRNLVKRAHDATAVNSPTFTALEGFAGDGATKYLDLNYNPNTEGENFVLNNGAIGIYSRTDSNGVEADMGARDADNNDLWIIARYSGQTYGRINSVAIGVQATNTNAQGLHIATREGSLAANNYLYKNKTTVDLVGWSSSAIPSLNLFGLGRNSPTGLAAPSTRQLSLIFASKHITTDIRDVIYDTFQTYMTSNGKEV